MINKTLPLDNNIYLENAVKILNEALKLDPQATQNLVNNRVECNEQLAKHPTIGVGYIDHWIKSGMKNFSDNAVYCIGLLGIINGILTNNYTDPCIGAVYEFTCTNCKITNDPKLDGVNSGDDCPICQNGKIILGNIVEFIITK